MVSPGPATARWALVRDRVRFSGVNRIPWLAMNGSYPRLPFGRSAARAVAATARSRSTSSCSITSRPAEEPTRLNVVAHEVELLVGVPRSPLLPGLEHWRLAGNEHDSAVSVGR
jgi:hypothetical protein